MKQLEFNKLNLGRAATLMRHAGITPPILYNALNISELYFGVRRVAAVLLLAMLTTATAWATETSTITVGSTDYTLFTGFTATDGNGRNYAKLVDGNTSTDWSATKNYDDPNAPANDFAGGTADPAFVEFHADEPFVPKGYVLTCDHENAGFWKPVEWALKAKLNEGDEWTTIQSSTTTLGAGKTFQIPCTNDGDNEYQYFRFEVYEVGTTMTVDLDELQFYGSLPAYTHLTVKAATCMATGIKVDCYRRNSDGKYFTDNTGTTELAESDVIAPIIPHTGEHHEATDVNIEYWQCSMCSKYFSDEGCTTEITKEQTKIYRTITIDSSISGLVTVAFSKTQALAGETIALFVSDLIDASTLKVNNGAVELTAETDIQYTFTMPAADVTVTADIAQSNADGDVLTGSIRHTVTITNGANITLSDATITGSIVCEGSTTITLVGTNSVSGATNKAGIQIGGSGTRLTIRGEGSLTVNGGDQSAGIGLSSLMNYDSNVSSGDIVIEGGTITATGGSWGAGIGTGVVKNTNNDNSTSVQFGNITIKGGSVTAIGGDSGDGIGKGYAYNGPTITIGTVTIYDGINTVDASSIKDFASVVYMHGETDVTASKTDYFAIGEDGNRRLIVQKPVIAEIAEQAYTGSEIKPEPTVTIGSIVLTKGTDYTYSYTNNTNVGTATVTVTFQGDYASLGYVEKTFTIGKATPAVITAPTAGTITYGQTLADSELTGGKVTGVGSEELSGTWSWNNGNTAPDVSDSGTTEYDVTFTPDDGTPYNTVATKVTLTVTRAKQSDFKFADATVTKTVGDAAFTADAPTGAAENPTITYASSNEAVATVDASTGVVTIVAAGLTTITATTSETTNYQTAMAKYTLRVIHSATLFAANSTHLWATFCDTYDRTIPEGCTAYTIKEVSGTTVTLNTALTTPIPAYTPVLVKRQSGELSQDIKPQYSADGTEPANYDSTTGLVTSEGNGFNFYGNAGDAVISAADAIYTVTGGFIHEGHDATGTASYVLCDGQFILVDENQGLAANRCLLNVSAGTGNSARQLSIVFGDATPLLSPEGEDEGASPRGGLVGVWYTLDGRKLDKQPTKKGLYINNNRKVVIE